ATRWGWASGSAWSSSARVQTSFRPRRSRCAWALARACAGASQSLGGSDMASNAPRREGEPLEEVRERKGIKKGLYLLPSAFTAANIGMGYFAVMAALRGFQLLGGGTSEGAGQAATGQVDNAWRAI